MQRFVIGSRGSPLALAQARLAQAALAQAAKTLPEFIDERFPIEIISTKGDQARDQRLSEIGGKGLFTRELDIWLAGGGVDVAVHSLKDVPGDFEESEIKLAAMLPREDPRDAFISNIAKTLQDLPQGASLGSASPRRIAQTKRLRPDLDIRLMRGNVHRRLHKINQGEADATYLAAAGLNRLGKIDAAASLIAPEEMLPAACQGIVALAVRADHEEARKLVAKIGDEDAAIAAAAERAFLRIIDGSCRTAVAALAERDGDALRLRAEALSPDGADRWARDETVTLGADPVDTAATLGRELGAAIKQDAGAALLAAAE